MNIVFYVVAFVLGYLTARQVHALAIQRMSEVWNQINELKKDLHDKFVQEQIEKMRVEVEKIIKK